MIYIFGLSLLGSLLTFYSGFGLGTILLPVFAMFFPVQVAVALTAIVHLSNNLIKFKLVGKFADWNLVKQFGIPSVIAAIGGALLLDWIPQNTLIMQWQIGENYFQIKLLQLIVGSVILLFSIWELVPALQHNSIFRSNLIIGGLLSGFFGGISGHQGALRSVFLINLSDNKHAIVGTSCVIALGVDLVRIPIYVSDMEFTWIEKNVLWLLTGIVGALIGSLAGNVFLNKSSVFSLRIITSVFLILFSLLFILGIISK